MGRVTLKTVAEKVGVSSMTVSNAFSRPDQLSAPLRARILAAAAELGYAGPDPAARTLAKGTTGTVGILLFDSLFSALNDEVSTTFLGAIAEELRPSGLALTLLPTPTDDASVIPARDVAMDGALVYSCSVINPSVEWLRKRKLPLVYVDQAQIPGISSVNIEDRAGALAAARHLVELGHRRVGILDVAGDDPSAAAEWHVPSERRAGWIEGLGPNTEVTWAHIEHGLQADDGYVAVHRLLTAERRPTGLLCHSDAFAATAMLVAEDLGIKVPDDLSIVGFDDNPLARRLRPQLTTVRQDVVAKGRSAAGALVTAVQRRRAGEAPPIRHLRLPTELVVRASTAPPPA